MRFTVIFLVALALPGCAVLHKTQLGDIEPQAKGTPVSVKVSETTIDFRELASMSKFAGSVAKAPGASSVGKALDTYTALFQMGPRTGTPVYNELYARLVPEMLRQKCPHGRLANILSVRETRSYPVVKGEIVRVDAICIN